jgi:hypothetical protein
VPAGTADGGQWTGEWWRWWQQLNRWRGCAHSSCAECFLRSAARGAEGAPARRQGSQSGY